MNSNDFGYQSKMKPKNASNSCNEGEKICNGYVIIKIGSLKTEKKADESKINLAKNTIEDKALKTLR